MSEWVTCCDVSRSQKSRLCKLLNGIVLCMYRVHKAQLNTSFMQGTVHTPLGNTRKIFLLGAIGKWSWDEIYLVFDPHWIPASYTCSSSVSPDLVPASSTFPSIQCIKIHAGVNNIMGSQSRPTGIIVWAPLLTLGREC